MTDLVETTTGQLVNDSFHYARARLKIKISIVFMAKEILHCCIGAHARVHVHFLRRVCMHSDRCFEHHACAGVSVKQKL